MRKMKAQLTVIVALLLVALTGASAAAQTNAEAQSSAPVEVVSFDWKYQGYASAETSSTCRKSAEPSSSGGVPTAMKITSEPGTASE